MGLWKEFKRWSCLVTLPWEGWNGNEEEGREECLFFSRNLKTIFFLPNSYDKSYLSLGIISINKNKGHSFIFYKERRLSNLRSTFVFMVPFSNFCFCELLWDINYSLVKTLYQQLISFLHPKLYPLTKFATLRGKLNWWYLF